MNLFRSRFIIVYTVGISLAVVVLSILLFITEQERDTARQDIGSVQASLQGASVAPGRACGVLDRREAEQLLGQTDLVREYTNVPAALSGKTNGLDNGAIDSCQYTDPSTSLTYADLYINWYQNPEQAEALFEAKLPKVGDKEELSTERYPQFKRMVYADGVLYGLKNQEFVTMSAQNSGQQPARELTFLLLDSIVEELAN